jgi:S1/P1 nuclease
MKKMILSLILIVVVFSSQSALGWNGTGHMLVARIAWENMSPTARQNVVNLLMQAPTNACLRDLFPNDTRPLVDRQREFFMRAATWPDIVRPRDNNDHRPCIQYHKRDWHFVDHFWSGLSGDLNSPPHDVPLPIAQVNAEERLQFFRTFVNSNSLATERAMGVAWILHLVGDIHQPLHTSGRVTSRPDEKQGDAGGNSFKLLPKLSLHSYWDGIVDRAVPRKPNQTFAKYLERVAGDFESSHPKSQFNLLPGQFDQWVLESLERAKNKAYPKSLKRGQLPSKSYQNSTFEVASESIPEAGYRLADLLNSLFG